MTEIATPHRHRDGTERSHELSTTGQHWHPPGGMPKAIAYTIGSRPEGAYLRAMNALELTWEDFQIELVQR